MTQVAQGTGGTARTGNAKGFYTPPALWRIQVVYEKRVIQIIVICCIFSALIGSIIYK
jgi:hypothetical protein